MLHFFVFALDGVVAAATTTLLGTALSAAFEVRSGRTSGRALSVDLFTDLVEGLLKRLTRLFDARNVIGREGRTYIGDLCLQLALLLRGDAIAEFGDALLGTVGRAIGEVALLDLFLAPLVFGCVRLGVAHHVVDLILVQAA